MPGIKKKFNYQSNLWLPALFSFLRITLRNIIKRKNVKCIFSGNNSLIAGWSWFLRWRHGGGVLIVLKLFARFYDDLVVKVGKVCKLGSDFKRLSNRFPKSLTSCLISFRNKLNFFFVNLILLRIWFFLKKNIWFSLQDFMKFVVDIFLFKTKFMINKKQFF